MPDEHSRGLSVADLARRWRKGEDQIRGWIKSGELRALNVASTLSGKPRYVVTPEALAAFEQRRLAATPLPPPKHKKRIKRSDIIDYYP
jgi:hypothetical protein